MAKAGAGGTGGPGAGGSAGSGIGDVLFSGGLAGDNGASSWGGGGGGAGSNANGAAGGDGAGAGTAGNYGGAGGNSAGGGGSSLSGGGAAQGAGGTGGTGAGGFVRLTYTTTSPPPSSNANLINSFTSPQVADVAGDDGDYWVQTGSEYLIQEYKKDWTNNTDSISIVWRGRTTLDTSISPVYLQIYNINSATWETLDIENMRPADVDFQMMGSQTSNVSNYYDSKFIVSFRIYQKVI